MKRVIVATCGKLEKEVEHLVLVNSHHRSFRAYIASMGVDEARGEAFTKEREESQRKVEESESIYGGVVSYYYVFAVNSFDEIEPFVEAELKRMTESSEKERDGVYQENLKTLLKSLKQTSYVSPVCGCSQELDSIFQEKCLSGFYVSGSDCLSYLEGVVRCITGESRKIRDMKFNFVEND